MKENDKKVGIKTNAKEQNKNNELNVNLKDELNAKSGSDFSDKTIKEKDSLGTKPQTKKASEVTKTQTQKESLGAKANTQKESLSSKPQVQEKDFLDSVKSGVDYSKQDDINPNQDAIVETNSTLDSDKDHKSGLIANIQKKFQTHERKKESYISARDSSKISRENRKITNAIERKRKRRFVPESEYVTKMRDNNNVVEFDNVHTYFFTDIGTVKAVDGVSFDIPAGKTVGVVGESGCGKSVTSLSLMQLVQRPQGQTVEGEIRFNAGDKAYNVVNAPASVMQSLRGNEMSMIFQEPMTSLNPVFRIGAQVDEVIMLHNKSMSKKEVKEKTISLLQLVGIANCDGVYKMFPHELSGGMRQRVMIAIALACNPKLIIGDEPTTALDVTIQAQILDILREIKTKINSSIMLITHDLGVIAEMADYVVVMYAGRIVEKGTARDIFNNPSHPYTIGLMKSKPVVGKDIDRLYNIPGNVPNPINMPNYCYFKDRCEKSIEMCNGAYPPLIKLSETHYTACYLYGNHEEGRKQ